MRLLPADNCLLIFDDGQGSFVVFLEQVQTLSNAIVRGASKKIIRKDKLSGKACFAYDENKRMLAVSTKLQVWKPVHRYLQVGL
jgi:hypothetical protein